MGVKTTDKGSNIMNRSVGIIWSMALCNFSFMRAKNNFMLKQQKIFFDFLRFCIGSTKEIPSSLQKELQELGLWKFAGAIMYIMQEVFGMPASQLIVPPNDK